MDDAIGTTAWPEHIPEVFDQHVWLFPGCKVTTCAVELLKSDGPQCSGQHTRHSHNVSGELADSQPWLRLKGLNGQDQHSVLPLDQIWA